MSEQLKEQLKEQLQKRCEDAGIKYDKRWNIESLEDALAAAAPEAQPEEAQEAATQAAPETRGLAAGLVVVTVTKAGDGKLHTGKTDGGRTLYHKRRDELVMPLDRAKALEARFYVEIED